jgi:hypothetical protein
MNFLEAFATRNISVGIDRLAHEVAKRGARKTHKQTWSTNLKEQKKLERDLQSKLKQSFAQYLERIKRGIELLIHAGLLKKIDTNALVTYALQLQGDKANTKILQHELNLSDELLISFHEYATSFFNREEFASAADIFLFLTLLNPFVPSFWTWLGISEEMNQQFDGASLAFLMAADTSEEGYGWAVRAAENLKRAGKSEEAQRILDLVIEKTTSSSQHAVLHQEAIKMRNW